MSEGDESEEDVKVRRKGRVVVDSELGNADDIGFGYLEQARAAIIEEDDDESPLLRTQSSAPTKYMKEGEKMLEEMIAKREAYIKNQM